MNPHSRGGTPLNEEVRSRSNVDRQFASFVGTYMDPWAPTNALSRQEQHAVPAVHQLQLDALSPSLNDRTGLSSHDIYEHTCTLPSFSMGPGNDVMLDAMLGGLGDVPDLGTATHSRMLPSMTSCDTPGASMGAEGSGGSAPVPGIEGVRKQKILEKNRRAQKRFREKQKAKMVDMKSMLQDLQSNLEETNRQKTCLQRQNESLLKALELRQNQIHTLAEAAQVDADGSNEPDFGAHMRSAAGALSSQLESGLTLHKCREMVPEAALARWRQYVEKLTGALVEAESPTAPEACRARLRKVATYASKFSHVLAIVNPRATRILLNSHLETGELAPDPSHCQGEVFWNETINAIALTQEQKDKILYLASMLVKSIKSCQSQREGFARKLTMLLPQTYGASGCVGAVCAAQDNMTELRRNFHNEHIAWTTFVAGVVANVLSYQQFARLCSRCYPYFPRTCALSTSPEYCSDFPSASGCVQSVLTLPATVASAYRFQLARQLAKGKDILELADMPYFLLPVGSSSDEFSKAGNAAPSAAEGATKASGVSTQCAVAHDSSPLLGGGQKRPKIDTYLPPNFR